MSYPFFKKRDFWLSAFMIGWIGSMVGCSSGEKAKNFAKESAARYWQDKAYPGKAYDVNVVEAEKMDGGQFRVKGLVDGETRVGVFNPETETFSEGYYSLAHERNKKIAELEEEVKYYREKSEGLEKENYKLKVRLGLEDEDESAKPQKQQKPKKEKFLKEDKKGSSQSEDREGRENHGGVEKSTDEKTPSSSDPEEEKKRP